MNQIDELRHRLELIDAPHPTLRTFSGLPKMNYAFFPGGSGLYRGPKAQRWPMDGILVLGSNFGCVDGFVNEHDELRCMDERGNPTWRNLLILLRGASINADDCFFTNAWPFLHVGEGNLSQYMDVWLATPDVRRVCLQFFRDTLAALQPKLVIALGTGPAAFLAHNWPEKLLSWDKRRWAAIDEHPVVRTTSTIVCTAITHPSMPNRRNRCTAYKTLEGEVALLVRAASLAGLNAN